MDEEKTHCGLIEKLLNSGVISGQGLWLIKIAVKGRRGSIFMKLFGLVNSSDRFLSYIPCCST